MRSARIASRRSGRFSPAAIRSRYLLAERRVLALRRGENRQAGVGVLPPIEEPLVGFPAFVRLPHLRERAAEVQVRLGRQGRQGGYRTAGDLREFAGGNIVVVERQVDDADREQQPGVV